MRKWEKLPIGMQCGDIRPYYDILKKKWFSLFLKRLFDIVVSFIMLFLLLPIFIIIAIAIKIDSKGPVFYRQERVTQYGKIFKIFKFRTMVQNADKIGTQVTINNDSRITKVGKIIRKYRLDEIPQLIDIFRGTMTFVGTRPEVKRYIDMYTNEMKATLLMRAGVTSLASIKYKNEDSLLKTSKDIDKTYVYEVLPGKMEYNLKSIKKFNVFNDIKIMILTVFAVITK